MTELNKIYQGDALEVLETIPDNHIDCEVTSPPYKTKDGFYSLSFTDIFCELYRVLKPGGLFFLNFGHLAEEKSRPFQLVIEAERCGFFLGETFIWLKDHYCPLQGDQHVNNLTEFIFMFYKDFPPTLDRLSVGVPYEDKTNKLRFGKGNDLRCAGNLWKIPLETIGAGKKRLHPDQFPVALPQRCLKLAGKPSFDKRKIVLDCFAGSGSTCIAAVRELWDYIGIELNPEYVAIAEKRIAKEYSLF